MQIEDVFQTLNIRSDPRTRALPGTGVRPRPLIELLRASREDEREFKQLVEAQQQQQLQPSGGSIEVASAGGEIAPNAGAPPRTMLYSMESMGCQMNSADAERMEGQLRSLGFSKAEKPIDAQVVVLNTCSIREHAQVTPDDSL